MEERLTVRDEPIPKGSLIEVTEPAPRSTPPLLLRGVVELLRGWRLLVGIPFAAAVVAAAVTLVLPYRYETDITIAPQTGASAALGQSGLPSLGGGFASVAAIAQGLGLGSGLAGGSALEYFSALVRSRRVAEQVLLAPLPPAIDPWTPHARNLLEVYRLRHPTLRENLEYGQRIYEKVVTVSVEPASGLLAIHVQAPTSDLALVMGKFVLNALNEANLDVKHQYARAQVAFMSDQSDEARSALEAAEDSLLAFYRANRTYQPSPTLVFEEGRLKRRVELAQAVYTSLTQQREAAKIAAAQNVPVFSIVDAPNAPALRAFPKRTRTVAFTALLVLLVVTMFLLFQAFYLVDPEAKLATSLELRGALRQTIREVWNAYARVVGRRAR